MPVGARDVLRRHAGVLARHVGQRLPGFDHVARRLAAVVGADGHVDLLADFDGIGVLDLRVGRFEHRHRGLVAARDFGQVLAALHLVLHVPLGRRCIALALVQRRLAHGRIDLLARRRRWRRRGWGVWTTDGSVGNRERHGVPSRWKHVRRQLHRTRRHAAPGARNRVNGRQSKKVSNARIVGAVTVGIRTSARVIKMSRSRGSKRRQTRHTALRLLYQA